jgi:hypothetical protein
VPAPRVLSHDWIGDDDLGRMRTLGKMRNLVRWGSRNRYVRTLTASVCSTERTRSSVDLEHRARQIRAWCERSIDFENDPPGIELLYQPEYLARLALAGIRIRCDCDDVATFSGAIAYSVGLSVQFRAVSFLDKRAPFAHVFTELGVPAHLGGGGPVVDVDITRAQQGLPPCISREMVIKV